MAEGKTVTALFTSDKTSNWCTIHGCQTKIKAGEEYFRIVLWMGSTKKHIRICKKCLVGRAAEYMSKHPEFKQEILEETIGG